MFKLIDYFIPHRSALPNVTRKIKLVTYTVAITALFALFYVLVSLLVTFYTGAAIMLASFVAYVLLLFLFRWKLSAGATANLFGAIGAASIFGCIYYSGGFQSPVLPWVASTPIVILLIAGRKSGYFWAMVSGLFIVLFAFWYADGHLLPVAYDANMEVLFVLTCHLGLVMIVLLIALVFENARKTAFNTINNQKNELEKTLKELQSTQEQLIHAEKMASLGELTAGIAHEIQNPLNFVNNFSELNTELLQELHEEAGKPRPQQDEAVQMELLAAISDNMQKIGLHGRRADSIVKSMLQHSRAGSGEKTPADVNQMVQEFVRLAYHGYRAKQPGFNTSYHVIEGAHLPMAVLNRQDVGRVLINLLNNAFYAVNERSKNETDAYNPHVLVKTFTTNGHIGIAVEDNGMGIPDSTRQKIFQPFFTTKPTGQGTGLGLSLSYDIITKGHGGQLTVTAAEGGGSIFTILLPATV